MTLLLDAPPAGAIPRSPEVAPPPYAEHQPRQDELQPTLDMFPVAPGAILIPYESTSNPEAYTDIRALHHALGNAGTDCTLSVHRTAPEFRWVAHNTYVETKPSQNFAVLTREGVGNPLPDILATLTAEAGPYSGRRIVYGGELHHSRLYQNDPGARPPIGLGNPANTNEATQQLQALMPRVGFFKGRKLARLTEEMAGLAASERQEHSWQERANIRVAAREVNQRIGNLLLNPRIRAEREASLARAARYIAAASIDSLPALPEATTERDPEPEPIRLLTIDKLDRRQQPAARELQARVEAYRVLLHFETDRSDRLYPNNWPPAVAQKQHDRIRQIEALEAELHGMLRAPSSTD